MADRVTADTVATSTVDFDVNRSGDTCDTILNTNSKIKKLVFTKKRKLDNNFNNSNYNVSDNVNDNVNIITVSDDAISVKDNVSIITVSDDAISVKDYVSDESNDNANDTFSDSASDIVSNVIADIGTYIIIKDNNVLSKIDESDGEVVEELTGLYNINPEVKDTPFNPNNKIEKLVLNKKRKLDIKCGNDNIIDDDVSDTGNDTDTDSCSDFISDAGSDSDSDIGNFIMNYEHDLRTVPESDRVFRVRSKTNNLIVLKPLTGNSVLENLQYHGSNVDKKYTYFVNNDNDYLENKITKMYKYALNEKYFTALRKKYNKISILNIKDKQFQVKCIKKFEHIKYTLAEYEGQINQFECPNNFSKITYVLQRLEKTNNINISIQPSQLGETLKTYTINKLNFPVIENSSSNYKHDIMVYDLTYGYIPTVYLPELEIFVKKLLKSRESQPYDIIEGEIEMMFLGYWKLETQDLKNYNEGINRKDKKNILSHIIYKINKKINDMPKDFCNKNIKILLTKVIQLVIFFGRFNESHCIPALSLVFLKNNIITMLTAFDFSSDVFEGMAMLFSELNIHNLYFPHTYNILIRNRDTICEWLYTMTNIHNLNDIDDSKKQSVFYNTIAKNIDSKKNHRAVFTKLDMFALLGRFYKNESQIPIDLCISCDNLFMILIYWVSDYVIDTGILKINLTAETSVLFFNNHNNHLIPWYFTTIIPFRYSESFAKKFKEAIITTIYAKSKVIKSTFDVEPSVLKNLVQLCHAYLSYALGPAMMRRGKPLTSAEWSRLFISAIGMFEKHMVMLNDKIIVSKKKSLPWLEDGIDDRDYKNEKLNVYDFMLNTLDTSDVERFPSHWDKQEKTKRKKLIKRKKIISCSDSEQSSVEGNSENTNKSENNENKCNEDKKCYDLSEDSDCVVDDFDTLTREKNILCNDLGIQLIHHGKQGPAAIVKKIHKRKQITDIANYKKKSKLHFLTDETAIENINTSVNNSHDTANVCEKNIKTNNTTNKLRNHKPLTDIDRFTLTGENYFKIIDGIKCFGIKSSKLISDSKTNRYGVLCSLCFRNQSKSQNIILDAGTAISCCMACMNLILKMLETNELIFEDIKDVLIQKVNDRFKAPLMFNEYDKVIDPIFPAMTKVNDVYGTTYNKLSIGFGKKLKSKEYYLDLCKKYGWSSVRKP